MCTVAVRCDSVYTGVSCGVIARTTHRVYGWVYSAVFSEQLMRLPWARLLPKQSIKNSDNLNRTRCKSLRFETVFIICEYCYCHLCHSFCFFLFGQDHNYGAPPPPTPPESPSPEPLLSPVPAKINGIFDEPIKLEVKVTASPEQVESKDEGVTRCIWWACCFAVFVKMVEVSVISQQQVKSCLEADGSTAQMCALVPHWLTMFDTLIVIRMPIWGAHAQLQAWDHTSSHFENWAKYMYMKIWKCHGQIYPFFFVIK